MNILPKLIMALFGVSAVLDIAEKIHNWGRDPKNNSRKVRLRRTVSTFHFTPSYVPLRGSCMVFSYKVGSPSRPLLRSNLSVNMTHVSSEVPRFFWKCGGHPNYFV